MISANEFQHLKGLWGEFVPVALLSQDGQSPKSINLMNVNDARGTLILIGVGIMNSSQLTLAYFLIDMREREIELNYFISKQGRKYICVV